MNDLVLVPSYWASVSGGKDSLFMLKLILENKDLYKLDGVVHFELETDFPFIKTVIDYMQSECEKRNIKFVRIKPSVSWYELYEKNGYPSRKARWCNSRYKLDCEKQLKKFLKSQGAYLVTYIGFCADEFKRIKDDKTKIYPLVDFGIEEDTILAWAQKQKIFNDYYLYNRRCGCMCCPMASIDNLIYTKKYYPDEFDYFMGLALKHEKEIAKRYGKEKFSVWQSNSKYDTEYYINKVTKALEQTTLF